MQHHCWCTLDNWKSQFVLHLLIIEGPLIVSVSPICGMSLEKMRISKHFFVLMKSMYRSGSHNMDRRRWNRLAQGWVRQGYIFTPFILSICGIHFEESWFGRWLAWFKTRRKNFNNLSYVDNTILIAEQDGGKIELRLNIKKTKTNNFKNST